MNLDEGINGRAFSVTIQNYTTQWAYEPTTGLYIPPGTTNTVIPLNGTQRAAILFQSPTGVQPAASGILQAKWDSEPATFQAGNTYAVNISGNVTIGNILAGSVAVSNVPAVTVNSGSVNIANVPAVTINSGNVAVTGSVSITGTPTVSISGTPAVTISGTPSVTIASGSVSITSGSVTVTGTITVIGTEGINSNYILAQFNVALAAAGTLQLTGGFAGQTTYVLRLMFQIVTTGVALVNYEMHVTAGDTPIDNFRTDVNQYVYRDYVGMPVAGGTTQTTRLRNTSGVAAGTMAGVLIAILK